MCGGYYSKNPTQTVFAGNGIDLECWWFTPVPFFRFDPLKVTPASPKPVARCVCVCVCVRARARARPYTHTNTYLHTYAYMHTYIGLGTQWPRILRPGMCFFLAE